VMEVGEGILMETRKTIKHILTLRLLSTDKIHTTFDFTLTFHCSKRGNFGLYFNFLSI
jgi:hypothetical protein